jgi:HEAT repeat protein
MPAFSSLIDDLKNERSSVRWAAAEALGKIGDERAVAPLKDALQDENSSVRRAVIEALGKLGTPAVLALINVLENGDDDAQWTAARMLGRIGDAQAVPALIDALKISSLCKAAVKALDRIGWIPNSGEDGAFYWIAKRKWEHCVVIGAPAILPLIDAIESGDDDLRWGAAETLGMIGDVRAVSALIHALKDEDDNVRCAAAEALGKIGDVGAVAALKGAFMDRNYRVHRAIDKALEALEN